MKKAIGAAVGVVAVAALALVIIPSTRDEIHWRWVSHRDETASYGSYVKTWPVGRHAAEAKLQYGSLGWADARTANTVQGFERYIQLHVDGKHVAEARDSIESLHWQEATTANTVQGFERYIQLHADGKHVAEARNKVLALTILLKVTYDVGRTPGNARPAERVLIEVGSTLLRTEFLLVIDRDTMARHLQTLRRNEPWGTTGKDCFENSDAVLAYMQVCFDQATFSPTDVELPRANDWQWEFANRRVQIRSEDECGMCSVIEYRIMTWDGGTYGDSRGITTRVHVATSVELECRRGQNVLWSKSFTRTLPKQTIGYSTQYEIVPWELIKWLRATIESGSLIPAATPR